MIRPTLLSLSCGLSVIASLHAAQDWPEFRGPTGQGHATSTKLPLQWSATQNVAWKQTIPGRGWSSPVVVNGRLYLTSAVGEDGSTPMSLRALCLEEASGRILWDVAVFGQEPAAAPRIHNKNSHASPTPLVADGRVYVHFGHQGTACLSLDGKVIWKNTDLSYPPVHGNGGSPILVENKLVFSCDGGSNPFVVALDKTTGKVIWKTPRVTPAKKTFSFSTPLLITVNGKQQIISPGSGAVCAFDPETGKEIWRARYGEGYSVIPRPVLGHGMIFIGTGYDSPIVMAIRVDGTGDVTDTHVAWTMKKGAPNTPSLLLVDTELYMVSDGGIASCVDAKTGAVHWQERVGGNHSASPLHANGRIYFQNEEGTGVVVKAGKTFEKLFSNDLAERTLASYAAAGDALYIRTAQHLYKIKGDATKTASAQ
ncbi:MAG: PQQ-binding-like beta-propeller repeat protein [Verrucomicrobia bacterium]|nr:PQQ-binding-like beta-propeller repeat protein [Verrucomicrobiota bacterium]